MSGPLDPSCVPSKTGKTVHIAGALKKNDIRSEVPTIDISEHIA